MPSQDHRETWDADVTYVCGVIDFAIWEVYGERVCCWTDVFMGVPAITKIDVAPVSAMACVSENASILGTPCWRAEAMLRAEATVLSRDVLDVMTVALLLSCTTLHCMGSKA
jgi:hypothetical protein